MNHIIIVVVFYLFLQMCGVWCVYRLTKNPSVVDVSWSLGLMISGLIYLWSMPINYRSAVIGILIIIWALRLAGYLYYARIMRGHVDKRYTALSTNWKMSQALGFFLNFQLQGVLIFIISSVFYWIGSSSNSSLNLIDQIAIIVVVLGIMGESLADLQLNQFKASQKGGVCKVGLWKYSRHPNYFFDWLTWMGFALFAVQSYPGYLGIISPLFLYILFTRITGPLTERGSVQSKGKKYIDYQNQTSMFFPWFRKKIDSGPQ